MIEWNGWKLYLSMNKLLLTERMITTKDYPLEKWRKLERLCMWLKAED